MADESTKKLLVKLGISTKEWKAAVDDIKKKLKDIQTEAKKDYDARLKAQKTELDNTKQLIADQKKLTAEAQAMTAVDKAKAAWQAKQVAEQKVKVAQTQLETAELKKQETAQITLERIEQSRLKTEQMRLRLQQTQAAAAARAARETRVGATGGGGGFLGGALMTLGGGVFGGGLPGMLAAGVTAGEMFEKVLEMTGEKLRDLGHEMVYATGVAGQLKEQFIKLATREGQNPEELLNRMTMATKGLVEHEQLLRVANNFMAGSLKLSADEMVRLTSMTLDLSRATGKDAATAMNALIRASLTGRTMILAMATGIDRASLQMQGLGKNIDPVVRKQLELHNIMDAMAKKLAEVGTPALTFVDLMKQMDVVNKSFIEDMAFSITHSKAFSEMIQTVSTWVLKATPGILEFANSIGQKLGGAFAYLRPLLEAGWHALSAVGSVVGSLISAIGSLIGLALKPLTDAFGATGNKITPFRAIIMGLGMGLELVTLSATQLGNSLKLVGNLMDALREGSLAKGKDAFVEFYKDVTAAQKKFEDGVKEQYKQATKPLETGQVFLGAASETQRKPFESEALNRQREKLEMEIAQTRSKIRLDAAIAELEEESRKEKEKYDMGLETLQQYVDKERAIKSKEHDARMQEIEDERKAKLAELQQEARGTKDPLTGAMVGGMDPTQLRLKQQLINLQMDEKAAQERKRSEKEDADFSKQLLEDQIAARKVYVSAINKIEQDGVKERTKLLEEEFKSGSLSADQYLAYKKALIQQEYTLRVQSLEQEADANKKNAAALAKVRGELIQATIKKEQELLDLEDKESQLRLDVIKNRYGQAKEILQSGIGLAQATGDQGTLVGGLEAEMDITTRYMHQLITLQQQLEASGQKYTKEWVEIQREIGNAQVQQVKLNEEIAKAKDFATPLAKMFGDISSSLGDVLGKGWTQAFGAISKALEQYAEMQKKVAQTGGTEEKGLWQSFKDLFHPVKTAADQAKSAMEVFQNGLKSSNDRVQKFTEGLGSQVDAMAGKITASGSTFNTVVDSSANQLKILAQAAQAAAQRLAGVGGQAPGEAAPGAGGPPADVTVTAPGAEVPTTVSELPNVISDTATKLTDFGTALQEKGSGQVEKFGAKLADFAGKIGDLVGSVAQTAGTIMGAKSTAGGAIGGLVSGGMTGMKIGSMFGPMGAAIGAGVGAVFGGIMGGLMGNKAAQAQKEADEIKAKLEAIKQGVADGSMTLGGSIQALKTGIAPSIARMEHGSKQEQAQAVELQKQYIQELTDLLNKQRQIMDTLVTDLGTLMAPEPYRDILTSLDQIVAKYKEFASAAAGNSAEMAMATQWLEKSLQAYAQTLQEKVNAANETAINDALHYNDLLQQRQELLDSTAKQEYDIMTQGVMARQRSTAMTKMGEIAALETAKNKQLTQIDEEISLTKYKVDAESKIFKLAGDRIGLEQQLLGIQEKSTDLQIAQVQAMMNSLTKLQSVLATGVLPKNLLDALGGVDINALSKLLGLPSPGLGPAGAGKPYIENMPPIYGQMIQVMSTVPGYSDFAQQMLNAAQTPFGSSARQAIQKEIDFYGHGPFGHPLMDAGLINPSLARNDPNWLGFYNWIMTGMQAATPGATGAFEGGGSIQRTGLKLMHEGEYVVSRQTQAAARAESSPSTVTSLVEHLLGSDLRKRIPGMLDDMSLAASAARKAHESQIYDIASERIKMEMELVNVQKEHAAAEIQRMAEMRKFFGDMQSGSLGVSSLEGAFAKIYELRGRYGSAGFFREYL